MTKNATQLITMSYCRRRHQLSQRATHINPKCHNANTARLLQPSSTQTDNDNNDSNCSIMTSTSNNNRLTDTRTPNPMEQLASPPEGAPIARHSMQFAPTRHRTIMIHSKLIHISTRTHNSHNSKTHKTRRTHKNWLTFLASLALLLLLTLPLTCLASSLLTSSSLLSNTGDSIANQQQTSTTSQQHQHHLHQSTISVMSAPDNSGLTNSAEQQSSASTRANHSSNNNDNSQQQVVTIQQRSVRQQQQRGQCHRQILIQQGITNLSQIVFKPSDICSTWQQMLNSNSNNNNNDQEQPWATIEELDLSQNKLQVLEYNSFAHLTSLKELKVSRNQLHRCEESTLANLKHLTSLDLSSNKLVALHNKFFAPVQATIERLLLQNNSISVLTPGLFHQLTSLQHLDLSRNEITSHWLNSDIFSDLHQLKYLDLSYNRISRIDPTTFQSLVQLETLSLQRNELSQIPSTIGHLVSLISLDLSFNTLQDISNASYLGSCQQLYSLVLESNRIENVTRGSFSSLPSLKVLNLANNRIKMIDQSTFEGKLNMIFCFVSFVLSLVLC